MDGGNRAHASTRRTRSPLLLPSLPAWCVFVCHTQFHGLFSYSVSFLPRVRLFVCVCGGGVVRSLLFVCFCFVSVCSPLFVCRFFVGVCFCGVLCVFCRVLCSFCLPEPGLPSCGGVLTKVLCHGCVIGDVCVSS